MELLSKSRAATVMAVVMGGAIAAVVAIITVGAEAAVTTMAGGIIAIGGDYRFRPFRGGRLSWRPLSLSAADAHQLACLLAVNVRPSHARTLGLSLARLRHRSHGMGDKVGFQYHISLVAAAG